MYTGNLPQRDSDGKFAPQFGQAWVKAEQRKQIEMKRRDAEIVAENVAWAAEHGIDEDELRFLFA